VGYFAENKKYTVEGVVEVVGGDTVALLNDINGLLSPAGMSKLNDNSGVLIEALHNIDVNKLDAVWGQISAWSHPLLYLATSTYSLASAKAKIDEMKERHPLIDDIDISKLDEWAGTWVQMHRHMGDKFMDIKLRNEDKVVDGKVVAKKDTADERAAKIAIKAAISKGAGVAADAMPADPREDVLPALVPSPAGSSDDEVAKKPVVLKKRKKRAKVEVVEVDSDSEAELLREYAKMTKSERVTFTEKAKAKDMSVSDDDEFQECIDALPWAEGVAAEAAANDEQPVHAKADIDDNKPKQTKAQRSAARARLWSSLNHEQPEEQGEDQTGLNSGSVPTEDPKGFNWKGCIFTGLVIIAAFAVMYFARNTEIAKNLMQQAGELFAGLAK